MAPTKAPYVCLRCAQALRAQHKSNAIRSFTTATVRRRQHLPTTAPYESSEQLPRWKQTPPAMQMPVRLRPVPNQPLWKVNTSQESVDEMYDRFIGRAGEAVKGQVESTRGRDLLPEDIKWLALTHKSFDHGRRGFNDHLAFLGKRTVDLQTSLALLNSPSPPELSPRGPKAHQHPAHDGLENLTVFSKNAVLEKTRLAQLAISYGIDRVVRWKPKKSDNLKGSGEDAVLAHTMYSIIGALALQRGGELAAKTVRDRILRPLGLK